MMYLPNFYSYALGVSADYKEYAKVMRDKIVPHIVEWKENWKKKHGVTDGNPDELAKRIDIDKAIIYLPINEGAPRNGTDDFGVAWLEYYNAIKAAAPNATIGGTNDWSYNQAFGTHPTENRNYELRDFILFCIENNCMPDIFTWHELDTFDMRDMKAHKAHFEDAWKTAYEDAGLPVPEIPQIVVNEYATMDDCGVPGRLVNWIARFEECGFYACLPFWHQANSLNDLASDANEGSSSWWTYKWYGDMSGELLSVESNTDYKELYGLASIDDNKRSVKVLLGGQDGAATVQLENVTDADSFKDVKNVHIKVESSDYAGMIGTQFEPDTVLEGNFPVNEDGSVIFDIDNMKFSSSFHVTMTAAADDADTSVVYTAPYIGYYEAEQGLAEDGAEVHNRYIGGDHWGASSYISDDNLVYTRTDGSKLTYTINVPTDGRYELNFIYGNGEGTTRNTPEESLSKNLYQDMAVDGEYRETLTMNNTLLTNTTGAKRVFLDLTAGEHTISLTSKQDGELLHDLLVVKYKGEYGKDIIFDKTYEGEQADFNELIGNTSTTVTTKTDDDGTTYITGLADKKVTEGGGARQSVVVRESGMYNLEFRYRSAAENKINVYVGNTATELSNLVTSAAAPASSSWSTAGAAVYLEKGINIIDVDSDMDIDLDNMRVYEAAADEFTVQAEECIPEGMDELFTKVDSNGAENGTYLAGMLGGDTAKGSGSGITAVISKERTDVEGDKFALTAALTNIDSESRTVKLGAVLNNTEYAEYSNPDVDYPNENTVLSSASETMTLSSAGKTRVFLWDNDMKPLTNAVDPVGAGIKKETIPVASAVSTADGTKVNVSGSAVVRFEEGDKVYLVVTHPAGFHSYDNIVISLKSAPKISSNAELWTAYSTGGSYVLGQDIVTVSNAGTSDENNLQNGSINGNGGIMLCGTDMQGGAMLFHNNAVNWTYSNVTIDGNKDNVTHTDACLWFMNGADITFENAVIRNFRTSAAERMAVTNVGGTVTFDNVEFSGNENIGENSEKFGEYTDIYSAPWGEASIVLKGATKAKIYYVSGGLDGSGLSEGCDVSVKADQAEGYEYLKGLVCDSEAVNTVYDDEAMTVTFSDAAEAE